MHDSPDVVFPFPIRQHARLRRFEAVRRLHRAGELFREGSGRPRVFGRIGHSGRVLAVALQMRRNGRARPCVCVRGSGRLAMSWVEWELGVEKASACIIHRETGGAIAGATAIYGLRGALEMVPMVFSQAKRKKSNYHSTKRRLSKHPPGTSSKGVPAPTPRAASSTPNPTRPAP